MKSELSLKTAVRGRKQIIEDLYFTAPYKVMTPFYNGDTMEIVQMSASAGMLSGDEYNLSLHIGERSNVIYGSQSYDKVFCSKGEQTVKNVSIEVRKEAKLIYMPYPIIPFEGSDYRGNTHIQLDPSSLFSYCDIYTCGRVGMGEMFKMNKFRNMLDVYIGDQLVFRDHTYIYPEGFRYQQIGMWGKYTHNGMLYVYHSDKDREEELVEKIRSISGEIDGQAGVTKCQKGIIVRALSCRSEWIWDWFCNIVEMI